MRIMKESGDFEVLPQEIVFLVLSFITSFDDLARASNVCKRFHLISRDQELWKNLCLLWWKEREFNQKKFNLEWIFKESGKNDWKWFAICFGNENKDNGPSVKLGLERVTIGEMKEAKLNGFGIRQVVGPSSSLTIGVFANGQFTSGTTVWESGAKHVGELKEGRRNGYGVYYYADGDVTIIF
jgi:hypothetical protein